MARLNTSKRKKIEAEILKNMSVIRGNIEKELKKREAEPEEKVDKEHVMAVINAWRDLTAGTVQ